MKGGSPGRHLHLAVVFQGTVLQVVDTRLPAPTSRILELQSTVRQEAVIQSLTWYCAQSLRLQWTQFYCELSFEID